MTAVDTRKTLTALFLDASVDSERPLDPEAARPILERFLDDARYAIEEHGGTVHRSVGEGLTGVFGVPAMHEDDALRALRAAVDAMTAAKRLTMENEGRGIKVHVWAGVNTGEALVSQEGAETVVTGDALSVASKLAESAEPGQVLMGAVTHRLVQMAVRTEPAGQVAIEGLTTPVPAHRLVEIGAHRREDERPLIGRDHDEAALLTSWRRAVGLPRAHLALVIGEPGVGKTRLIESVTSVIQDEALVLSTRYPSYGRLASLRPLEDIVAQAAGFDATDSRLKRKTKLEAISPTEGDAATAILDRLAQIGGATERVSAPEELFWATRELLDSLARVRPVAIFLDDMHHADPWFFDQVVDLVARSSAAPILVIAAGRMEIAELFSSRAEVPDAVTLRLAPLGQEGARRLIEDLAAPASIEERLVNGIVEATGGNPLFVQETVSMLTDTGTIRREDGRWTTDADLSRVRVPTTLQAVIGTRLEELEGTERSLVDAAAVAGPSTSIALLAALPGMENRSAGDDIRSLVRKGLLVELEGGHVGFREGLVREVAYGLVTSERRADLHLFVAQSLEADERELIGFHLEQACLLRQAAGRRDDATLDVGARAGVALAGAGREALERFDIRVAADLFERAAALPGAEADALEIRVELCHCLFELGRLDGLEELATQTIDRARALSLLPTMYRAEIIRCQHRSHFSDQAGWLRDATRIAQAAIPIFQEAGDPLGLADAYELWGEVDWVQNRFAAATSMYEKGFEAADSAKNERRSGKLITELSAALVWGPAPAPDGIRLCEKLLEKVSANRYVESRCLLYLAAFKAMRGDFPQARGLARESEAIAEDLGLRLLAAAGKQITGMIEMLAGDARAAHAQLNAGHQTLVGLGEKAYAAGIAADLAEALFTIGEIEQAEKMTIAAEQSADEDEVDVQVLWRRTRAKVMASRGEIESAIALANEAVELSEKTDATNMQADALMGQAEVLRMAGQLDLARSTLERAQALYEAKGNEVSAEAAQKAVGAL